jgi:4-amino-4-deoxy-L-arabinose transferase-like glycosyltransferase
MGDGMITGLNARLTILFAVTVMAVLPALCVPQIQSNWGYHNDEPTKVIQILDGVWNLRHPPLMLGLVDMLSKLAGWTDAQQVAVCGRLLSAVSVGIAVACCMLIAALRAGTMAGLGTGVILLFQPYLFEIGHYFKEDSVFLAGLMAALLAMFCCEQSRGRWPEVFLAVALALTVSAKYIGWCLLPPLLLFCRLNRKKYAGRAAHYWLWPLAVSALLILALNAPLLANWHGFREALGDEIYRLEKGDYGMNAAHSMAFNYLALLAIQVPPPLLSGYLFYLCYRLARYRSTGPAEWIFLGLPLLALALLALTEKYSERYVLPLLVLTYTAGFYGVLAAAGELLKERQRILPLKAALAVLMAASSCVFTFGNWSKIYRGFQHDSRAELTAWIRGNLPADAMIAEDSYAKINPYDLQERVLINNFFVADIGSIEELKRMGVTHVIISYDVYHRFVDGSVKPPPNQRDDFQRRKLFYETARKERKVLWQDVNANPKALHPGLMLIELPDEPVLN